MICPALAQMHTPCRQWPHLDLLTGKHEKLAEAPAKVDNVALAPDGTIYFSSGIDVYALRR